MKKSLIFGLGLGGLIIYAPISLLLFLMVAGLLLFLSKRNLSERTILTKLVVLALALRILFTFVTLFYLSIMQMDLHESLFTKVIGHSPQLFRDFQREVANGIRLGRYYSGEYGKFALPLEEVAFEKRSFCLHFGSFTQGFLNSVFGRSVLNFLVFPLVGVWAVILIYYLAKELFGRNVAVSASFILAVLPSFIIWSCINVRMSLAIVAILLIALCLIKFSKKNDPKLLLVIALSVFSFRFYKYKFVEPLAAFTLLALFFTIKMNFKIRKILMIALIVFIGLNPWAQTKIKDLVLRAAINQRNFAVYEMGNNYRIYDDFVYRIDLGKTRLVSIFTLLKALPKGMAYFLFAPFPWKTINTLRLYSYPQTLFWYFLSPFALVGILLGLRYNRQRTLPLLLFFILWIILLSLVMGNVGTAARHKDFIAPFFYIFASAGIIKVLGKKVFDNEAILK